MVRVREASGHRWVILRPATEYGALALRPADRNARRGWRRPLLVSVMLGCTMSFLASGVLTLRIAGPAAIYWGFVPLAGIAGLAVAVSRHPTSRSFSETVDLFFAGYGTWLVWLIGLCVLWSFLPPVRAFDFTTIWLYGASAVAVVWSAYIDFCFFRFVMCRSPSGALRDLLLQRLISWPLIVAIFGAPAIPPAIAARFLTRFAA
jgi:hypothetical protein